MAEERAAAAIDQSATSRRVVRGTLTYGLASVLQRAAPLLLLPIFAQIIGPDEFGQIGIILTLSAALTTVAGLGLETPVFRGYRRFSGDTEGLVAFVSSVGWFGLAAPWLVAAVALLLFGPLAISGFDLPPAAVILGAIVAAATASATVIPLAILRAQERLRTYLALTSVQVVASAGLAILFVIALDLGVVGWMLASSIAAILLLIRAVRSLGMPLASRMDRSTIAAALALGLPLIPHALAHWGLAVSDRAILGAFVQPSVVGVYYIAFLFSLPVSLVAIAIAQATQPLFAEAGDAVEGQETLARVVSIQSVLVILAGAAVALIGPPASQLMLPADFAEAARFIPILAGGATLFGLYLPPMNGISVMAGRASLVWMITLAAAGVNIGLNLLLVPRFGAVAAAWNTVIGYAVLLIGVFAYMRVVCKPPLRYEWGQVSYGACVVLLATMIGLAVSSGTPVIDLLLRAVLVAAAGILLVLGPLRREARAMLGVLRPTTNRVRQ